MRTLPLLLPAVLAAFSSLPLVAQDPLVRVRLRHPEPPTPWAPTSSLAVEVEVVHPADVDDAAATTPIVLAPAHGGFAECVTLQAFDATDRPLAWAFRPSAPSGARLVLRRGMPLRLGFALAADPARTLATPRCELRAELAVADGSGWRGRVAAAPCAVPLAAMPGMPAAPLELGVAGGSTLVVGAPWVVTITLPPSVATGRDEDLRTGYTLRWRDTGGKELPLAPAFVAGPPATPDGRQLREIGFGPLLAVFPGDATKNLAAGELYLEVEHAAAGARGAGTLVCSVLAAGAPGVERLTVAARLAEAQALLWHAEYGNSVHVERQVAAAVAVLRQAEPSALAVFATAPQDPATALLLAELYRLLDDRASAEAFARVALGAWTPPPHAENEPADAPPRELRQLLAALEAGEPPTTKRVLPYLRGALGVGAAAVGEPAGSAPAPGAGGPLPAADGSLRQWARSARASSEYRTTDYAATQVTGAPDVGRAGDSPKAWASKLADGGEEWLEVTFAQAVRATSLRIVQSHAPGAIVRLEAIAADGTAAVVWTGPDATIYPKQSIGVLTATFPATAQPVARFKIVLDTKRVADWNEIDAVELLGRRD
ncbi:MAG: hypothetical protein JNL12_07530 [Planctomycetes bacterium]|nr:hypothetical protein [Planctomycetota bacterium]